MESAKYNKGFQMKISLKFLAIVFLITVFIPLFVFAQKDSTSKINKKRLVPMVTTVGLAYTAAWVGLDALWYKNYPHSAFHFFNDDKEWLQIDKFGHAMTSFEESRLGVDLLKWCGASRKKAIVYGSITGFLLEAPIELFDGLSAEYGASLGDLTADATGSLMVLGQYLLWDDLRIHLKYSFHQTRYAALRPNEFGTSITQQWLKDYNGQTYWFCANIHSFMKKESRFPKWLNLAIGYGAEGMVYADKKDNIAAGYQSYRQYYLSVDIDLTKIKTRSVFLRKLFYAVNLVHLPAPALEFNKNGLKFHPIYI